MNKKNTINFWSWFFKKIYNVIKEMWNESRNTKIIVCSIVYWICFLIFLIVFLPNDVWLVEYSLYCYLSILLPVFVLGLSALYSLYEYEAKQND